MPRSNFIHLKRKQLDATLQAFQGISVRPPQGGWIRAIRTAVGMTMEQLGKRLGKSRQSIIQFEKNEVGGKLNIATLQKIANALECDLIIALRPRAGSLEETVRAQAERKATQLNDGVFHTMALEAQTDGLDPKPDISQEVDWWITTNSARLWD